ncbi:MAG: FRG domain-containing protein [Methylobacter sp.]|nr:MAG: FRG domain-containing protein [Methylobacter sp.]
MTEIEINSTAELIERLNNLPNHFFYRGHANADWGLQSSLERIIGNKWSSEEAKKFEELSFIQFKPKFHLYDNENVIPETKLAWLSIMQHYGVPTRLLDFTESPYVALYFALEAYDPHSNHDLAIFALDYKGIMDCSIGHISSKDEEFKETRSSVLEKQDEIFEKIVDRFSYDIIWIAEPKQLNARLDRQAGSFLLSGNRSLKIQDVLDSKPYENVTMYKYRINHSLYTGIFALLRKMNITSKSLYGDLDGLARSIKMQMQVYSV